MASKRQTAAILFADLVGSSKIPGDQLVLQSQLRLKTFVSQQSAIASPMYVNTWGDGVLFAFADPHDALECALHLRDWVANYNWKRRGFPVSLQVRIGLHAAVVNIIEGGGDSTVLDISGRNVNLAARIEPIADPNTILCSEAFYVLVRDEAADFVTFTDLGMLGGSQCEAWAINDRGQIAGSSQTDFGTMRAVLRDKGKMADLGTLGGENSEALGSAPTGRSWAQPKPGHRRCTPFSGRMGP